MGPFGVTGFLWVYWEHHRGFWVLRCGPYSGLFIENSTCLGHSDGFEYGLIGPALGVTVYPLLVPRDRFNQDPCHWVHQSPPPPPPPHLNIIQVAFGNPNLFPWD